MIDTWNEWKNSCTIFLTVLVIDSYFKPSKDTLQHTLNYATGGKTVFT